MRQRDAQATDHRTRLAAAMLLSLLSYITVTPDTSLVAGLAAERKIAPQAGDTTTATPPGQLEDSLDREAKELIGLIAKPEPSKFPSHCSEKGVAFGTDAPAISRRALRKQVLNKYGIFCVLFDTACLRRMPDYEQDYSYHDLIASASSQEMRTRVLRDESGVGGWLTLRLKGGFIERVPIENPLEFEFVYEKGAWKLIAVSYR